MPAVFPAQHHYTMYLCCEKTDNLYAQGAFAMVHIFLARQKPFFFNPKSSEIDRISTGQIPPVGVQ